VAIVVTLIDPLKPEAHQVSSDWTPGPRPKSSYRATQRNEAREKDPYGRDPRLKDFRNFLTLIWHFLRLPTPSPVQLSLAWWLQHGPERATILGFRGMAKSWITGAYILHTLYWDPQKKIMVCSASKDRAIQTVQWCLALIREMPELQWLAPDTSRNQRASGNQFDVGPAMPDQSPSLKGVGITGQKTGSRAHLIVPDDVEIPENSMTVVMREKISEGVKEFDAILHPGGKIKFLGTPQCEDSLYPKLTRRGYTMRIWPSEYPDAKMRAKYGERLSPYILTMVTKDPTLVGHSVWPSRFSDEDLAARKLSYGRSGYALQFLLDTSMSDAEKYPLKLKDLIVDGVDQIMGPDVISWGNGPDLVQQDLPLFGFEGDRFYQPASRSKTSSKYNSVKASIDSSGRGSNETVLTIGSELHGRVFVLYQEGWKDGYASPTLTAIARALVQFRVNTVYIEDNFGDGMFLALLTPHILKAWKDYNDKKPVREHGSTGIEAIKSPRVQKEIRILSVLEPACQGHRVVISTDVINKDHASVIAYQDTVGTDHAHMYSLFFQMTHLTRERECLLQDDRIEGLAMLLAQYATVLGINPWESAAEREEERIEAELEALMEEADDVGQYQGGGPGWDRHKSAVRPS
jgi:hypothetical protein